MLIVGGGIGIAQLWLPWLAHGGVSTTGWDTFSELKAVLSSGGGAATAFGGYAILAVVVTGVASALLGIMMLLPLDHRPPAVIALVTALVALLCALYWLLWHGGSSTTLGDLFGAATVGWYLFLLSGLVALVGAAKALASST